MLGLKLNHVKGPPEISYMSVNGVINGSDDVCSLGIKPLFEPVLICQLDF